MKNKIKEVLKIYQDTYTYLEEEQYDTLAQNIIDMVVEKIEGVEVNYFLDAQAFIRKDKLINSLKQD